jgi:hypothetical protein
VSGLSRHCRRGGVRQLGAGVARRALPLAGEDAHAVDLLLGQRGLVAGQELVDRRLVGDEQDYSCTASPRREKFACSG